MPPILQFFLRWQIKGFFSPHYLNRLVQWNLDTTSLDTASILVLSQFLRMPDFFPSLSLLIKPQYSVIFTTSILLLHQFFCKPKILFFFLYISTSIQHQYEKWNLHNRSKLIVNEKNGLSKVPLCIWKRNSFFFHHVINFHHIVEYSMPVL